MRPSGQVGEMPYADLSDIEFPQGYVIPRSGTIAAIYQNGFEIGEEVVKLWRAGGSHAVAAEFVMSYYRSMGFEDAVEIAFLRDDPDCVGAVRVTAKDKSGFDYMTYSVWQAYGKIYFDRG
jgi:hypothetical protein